MLSLINFALLQVGESDEEQYKQPCGNCLQTLTINTNIMCWNNGKSGDDYEEKTLCMNCYWGAGGAFGVNGSFWRTDRNEDNLEEILEYKLDINEDLGPS